MYYSIKIEMSELVLLMTYTHDCIAKKINVYDLFHEIKEGHTQIQIMPYNCQHS